jgi:hypothetical protein
VSYTNEIDLIFENENDPLESTTTASAENSEVGGLSPTLLSCNGFHVMAIMVDFEVE